MSAASSICLRAAAKTVRWPSQKGLAPRGCCAIMAGRIFARVVIGRSADSPVEIILICAGFKPRPIPGRPARRRPGEVVSLKSTTLGEQPREQS